MNKFNLIECGNTIFSSYDLEEVEEYLANGISEECLCADDCEIVIN